MTRDAGAGMAVHPFPTLAQNTRLNASRLLVGCG